MGAFLRNSNMENVMDLRSLAPFRGQGALSRPDSSLFGSLQREVDRLFEDFTRTVAPINGGNMLMPSIDITETDKEIEITVDLPGLERKDVEISLENDVLTIRGEKKFEAGSDDRGNQSSQKAQNGKKGQQDQQSQDNQNKRYHVAERTYGMFYRVIQLPPGIDTSKVQATMSNGVLKIAIPKPERSRAAKIEVKEGQQAKEAA
jgi:HSP20 family protein